MRRLILLAGDSGGQLEFRDSPLGTGMHGMTRAEHVLVRRCVVPLHDECVSNELSGWTVKFFVQFIMRPGHGQNILKLNCKGWERNAILLLLTLGWGSRAAVDVHRDVGLLLEQHIGGTRDELVTSDLAVAVYIKLLPHFLDHFGVFH